MPWMHPWAWRMTSRLESAASGAEVALSTTSCTYCMHHQIQRILYGCTETL